MLGQVFRFKPKLVACLLFCFAGLTFVIKQLSLLGFQESVTCRYMNWPHVACRLPQARHIGRFQGRNQQAEASDRDCERIYINAMNGIERSLHAGMKVITWRFPLPLRQDPMKRAQ